MQQIKLKKGLDVPMSGEAALQIGSVCRPSVYKIVPDHFAGLTPKLDVKEGESVKAGQALFHDKQFSEMKVTSPVSGKVVEICRGERRKVLYIAVEADAKQEYLTIDTKDAKAALLESGLWTLIKQRPYDCIAIPSKQPRAIFISSFDSAPLAPDYNFVVKGHAAELQAAVDALATIAPVFIGVRKGAEAAEVAGLKNCELYSVEGAHPAGNVGVQLGNLAPLAKGETVFTINIQDLMLIGRLFQKGTVDMQKLVAVTGDMAYEPQYYRVLPGMPVSALVNGNVHQEVETRIVNGNALSGHKMELDEMIDLYMNQLTILREGTETHEFMGWLLPRFSAFNASKTDPAKLLDNCVIRYIFGRKHYDWDARLKGGRRAIIVSGEYDKVFPMDIYPEYLIKAMIAGNLDKMEQLGAYEVAPEDFALCEYVCTSKMPLQAIVRTALDNMKKEIE